jgi:hypothetical protein
MRTRRKYGKGGVAPQERLLQPRRLNQKASPTKRLLNQGFSNQELLQPRRPTQESMTTGVTPEIVHMCDVPGVYGAEPHS